MARQQDLIEDRNIPALDEAAEALHKARTKRIKMLQTECELADALLKLMKAHKRITYNFDGNEVVVVPGKEKVKVRSEKDAEEEED